MQVEGQQGKDLSFPLATGARVSNTYATYPCQGDNPPKGGLNPRIFFRGIPGGGKERSGQGWACGALASR